jgi:hypothetical protein
MKGRPYAAVIVRDAPGRYHAGIETDQSGAWRYR